MKMTKEQLKEIDRIIEEGYERGNQIYGYWHCKQCDEEDLPSNIAVGYTPIGVQVWCDNHNRNIRHVDFCGHKVRELNASPLTNVEEIA